MTIARRPARRLAATGAAALLLAACAPVTNQSDAPLSDGVRVAVGPAVVSDLLVVADDAGTTGRVLGAVRADAAVEVTLTVGQSADPAAAVDLAAGGSYSFGATGTTPTLVEDLAAKPGATVAITVTADGLSQTVQAPVVGANLPEYATFVPTPAAG